VPLEKLFDHNDVPYKPDKKEKDPPVCEHNIGSQNHPKFINLSVELTADQRSEYCNNIIVKTILLKINEEGKIILEMETFLET
jgi:hypothetical protein